MQAVSAPGARPSASDHVPGLRDPRPPRCLDEDGYPYLLDRREDLVISGGVNIYPVEYPVEVEQRLSLHPAVADVAVVSPGRVAAHPRGRHVAAARVAKNSMPT